MAYTVTVLKMSEDKKTADVEVSDGEFTMTCSTLTGEDGATALKKAFKAAKKASSDGASEKAAVAADIQDELNKKQGMTDG